MNERAKAILDFWFIQSSMEDWFKKDDKYDEKIISELINKDEIYKEDIIVLPITSFSLLFP